MGRRQTLERVQRLLRLALLHHAHDGVQDDNQQDQCRFEEFLRVAFHTGDDKRNDGSDDQNQDHYILELIEKALQIGLFLLFAQLVLSVLLTLVLYLRVIQTTDCIGMQGIEHLLQGIMMSVQ